jgi:hypothetical protein
MRGAFEMKIFEGGGGGGGGGDAGETVNPGDEINLGG